MRMYLSMPKLSRSVTTEVDMPKVTPPMTMKQALLT